MEQTINFNEYVEKSLKTFAEKMREIEDRLENERLKQSQTPDATESVTEAMQNLFKLSDGERKSKGVSVSYDRKKNIVIPTFLQNTIFTSPTNTLAQPFHGVEYFQDKFPFVRPLNFRRVNARILQYPNNFAQVVSEGSVKPEANVSLTSVLVNAFKVAVRVTVTEEQERFEAQVVESVLNAMETDLRAILHWAIINDMVGYLIGFNPVPYTNTVPRANIYDLFGKMIEQYNVNAMGTYDSDGFIDFYIYPHNYGAQLKFLKDANGNYVSGAGIDEFVTSTSNKVITSNFFDWSIGLSASNMILYLDNEITIKEGYATGDFEANRKTYIIEQYYMLVPKSLNVGIVSFNTASDIATISI